MIKITVSLITLVMITLTTIHTLGMLQSVTTAQAKDTLLFFSASWCGPCKV